MARDLDSMLKFGGGGGGGGGRRLGRDSTKVAFQVRTLRENNLSDTCSELRLRSETLESELA